MSAAPPPPPQFRQARRLVWPLLAAAALFALPAGAVIAVIIAALALRVARRAIRHRAARRAGASRSGAGRTPGASGAIQLGHDPQGRAVTIPPEALAAHGLILGATGAGKTTTMMKLLDQQIARGGPVVVIDLKGSPALASTLHSAAGTAGRSFLQWTPDGGAHWNPLATGNATELKDKLLATERFTEPHYRRAAERYLQLAIQVAHETEPDRELTLARVVDLLAPARLAIAARKLAPERAQHVREYLGGLTRDQHSAISGLGARLAVITESQAGPFLEPAPAAPGAGGTKLDLRAALGGSDVVLFSLNSSTYGSLSATLGTLAVQDLVASAGARISAGGSHPRQAIVAIDEFSALRSENILSLFSRGREAGVSVMLATQELADLDRAGASVREEILGNTAYKIAHRQDVPESALAIARLSGTVRVWEQSFHTRPGRLGLPGERSESARLVNRHRVDPELVSTLGTGDAVVVLKAPQARVHVARVERAQPQPSVRSGPAPRGGTAWWRRGRERSR